MNTTHIAANPPVEAVFQLVGSNFTLLRQRNLAVTNASTFVKLFIDGSVTSKALVIDIYIKTNGTYNVVQRDYGNFLSSRQVVKPEEPAYLTFNVPFPTYDVVTSKNIY